MSQAPSIFASWLDAPFLKELTGKQLYEMIVAVKDRNVTGECECYVENGTAFVLGFADGQPLFDREKIAEVLKRPSVVAAWMPGKVAAGAHPAEPVVPAEVTTALQNIIGQSACFQADDQWLVVLKNATEVLASDDHAAGVNLATGLAAEINGAFLELTRGRSLERFSLDVGGDRFGFETLGGNWNAVFRATTGSQADALDCTRALRRKIADMGEDTGSFDLQSRADTSSEAQYCLVRPRLYQSVEQRFWEWGKAEYPDCPWDQFWFQYDSDVIFSSSKDGESQQERGGAISELNQLIRQGFERLTQSNAGNFVLYADGVTVWCDFFKHGFWATRFADAKTGYRKTADAAARQGWSLLREIFGPPHA